MLKLSEVQTKLAEQLLISIRNRESVVTYEELAERITPPIFPIQVGKEIGEISKLSFELGLPFISARVVNKHTGTAGKGFYPFYKMYGLDTQGKTEEQLCSLENKKIRECTEWYRLADYLGLDLDLTRPKQPEIRLLPMNKSEEFPNESIEEIQNYYFLGSLISERKGYYNYKESGLICPNGSLILFQMEGMIIASAELVRVEKHEEPIDGKYKGAYVFDTVSIEVFDPITAEELSCIDSTFDGFSQVKQRLDASKLGQFKNLITLKQQPLIAEEIAPKEAVRYSEGAKHQITINAYERNYKARQDCICSQGSTCTICGFDFGEFYGEEFSGKIHVHHVIPLSEIDETYEVNPDSDLIPVCPNCHLILHSKAGGTYSAEEVISRIERQNEAKLDK